MYTTFSCIFKFVLLVVLLLLREHDDVSQCISFSLNGVKVERKEMKQMNPIDVHRLGG